MIYFQVCLSKLPRNDLVLIILREHFLGNSRRLVRGSSSNRPEKGQHRLSLYRRSPSLNLETWGEWDEGSVERKHICNLCHRGFNRPSSLRIHMNTHTGATREFLATHFRFDCIDEFSTAKRSSVLSLAAVEHSTSIQICVVIIATIPPLCLSIPFRPRVLPHLTHPVTLRRKADGHLRATLLRLRGPVPPKSILASASLNLFGILPHDRILLPCGMFILSLSDAHVGTNQLQNRKKAMHIIMTVTEHEEARDAVICVFRILIPCHHRRRQNVIRRLSSCGHLNVLPAGRTRVVQCTVSLE